MKKIMSLFILTILIFSCSDSSIELTNEDDATVKNVKIPNKVFSQGDELIISADNFLVGQTYKITFPVNIDVNVTAISTNNISVKIPTDAVSGSISLTYKNKTKIIGSITIEKKEDLYLYYKSKGKLVNLDIETGNLTDIKSFSISGSIGGSAYHPQKNEYILFENNTDPNFVRINLDTQSIVYKTVNSSNIVGDGSDVFSNMVISY